MNKPLFTLQMHRKNQSKNSDVGDLTGRFENGDHDDAAHATPRLPKVRNMTRLTAIVLAIAAAATHRSSFLGADAAFATVHRKKSVGVGAVAAAAGTGRKVLLPQGRPQETTSVLHAQKKPVNDLKPPQGDDGDSKVNYVRIFSPLNPYMVRPRYSGKSPGLIRLTSPIASHSLARCPTAGLMQWFVYMFLFIFGADAVKHV
jgi:hypothetical protein